LKIAGFFDNYSQFILLGFVFNNSMAFGFVDNPYQYI